MILWLADKQSKGLSSLLAIVGAEDVIVLTGDAVYSSLSIAQGVSARVIAFEPDCNIRGLAISSDRLITLEDLLMLSIKAKKIVRL